MRASTKTTTNCLASWSRAALFSDLAGCPRWQAQPQTLSVRGSFHTELHFIVFDTPVILLPYRILRRSLRATAARSGFTGCDSFDPLADCSSPYISRVHILPLSRGLRADETCLRAVCKSGWSMGCSILGRPFFSRHWSPPNGLMKKKVEKNDRGPGQESGSGRGSSRLPLPFVSGFAVDDKSMEYLVIDAAPNASRHKRCDDRTAAYMTVGQRPQTDDVETTGVEMHSVVLPTAQCVETNPRSSLLEVVEGGYQNR